MNLSFDKGDPTRPKGHALVYFRVNTEPDKVYATYVVSLPVKADLSKYVPPFLANHLGSAQLRDDDLVYADSMFSFDLPRMMESVTEAVQEYSRICDDFFNGDAPVATPLVESNAGEVLEAEDTSFQVNEVLFSFMSENDKLTELSRLLGKLRFAQEGQDSGMGNEASGEITSLARYLPAEFQMTNLLAAAQDASQRGSKLAQLYLDRCFRLSAGDSGSAQDLEEEIQSLEGQG